MSNYSMPTHKLKVESKTAADTIVQAVIAMKLALFYKETPFWNMHDHHQCITESDLESRIAEMIDPDDLMMLPSRQITESIKRLRLHPALKVDLDAFFRERQNQLNVANGVYDIMTQKLTERKPDDFFDYILTFSYRANCKLDDALAFKKFVETSIGVENYQCLMRTLGYCISSLTKGRKAFLLYGIGKTGKSTLLNLLESVVCEGLVSHEPFHTMASQQSKAKYIGKRINISRDNNNVPMRHEDSFKSLISCEKTTGRFLYENTKDFLPTLKFIFASNCELNFAHPDDAVYDRLVIIPFTKEVKESDINLEEKLMAERDIIFSLAADSLKELIEANYDFKMSLEGEEYIRHCRSALHSVEEFLAERTTLDASGCVSSVKLNRAYESWCQNNNIKPVSRNEFYKQVRSYSREIKYCKVVPVDNRVNGFKGIRLNLPWGEEMMINE